MSTCFCDRPTYKCQAYEVTVSSRKSCVTIWTDSLHINCKETCLLRQIHLEHQNCHNYKISLKWNKLWGDFENEMCTLIYCKLDIILSYEVASGNEITPCNKIDKPLVVYRFSGNVMTSIITLRT